MVDIRQQMHPITETVGSNHAALRGYGQGLLATLPRSFPTHFRPVRQGMTKGIRKTGWRALRFLELATYISTKAIAFENEEWDELLAFGTFGRILEDAVGAFVAVPDPWKRDDCPDPVEFSDNTRSESRAQTEAG